MPDALSPTERLPWLDPAAPPTERLPWLPNKTPPPVTPKRIGSGAALFAAGAASAVIAFAGWSWTQRAVVVPEPQAANVETVPLPRPTILQPVDAAPQSRSAAEIKALTPEPPPPVKRVAMERRQQAQLNSKRDPRSSSHQDQVAAAQQTRQAAVTRQSPAVVGPAGARLQTAQPPQLWQSRQTAGAAGRLVQIGAFGSRHQAKLGWRRMERSYPAVGRLPAVVVEARNSKGRKFYRFQIGTTSHAHSEILCQRMQRIAYSCAVIGLPWKAKIER